MVLDDLYCGNIYPAEQVVPHEKEYRKLHKKRWSDDRLQFFRSPLPNFVAVCPLSGFSDLWR